VARYLEGRYPVAGLPGERIFTFRART